MLGILQQIKELHSRTLIKDPNFEFKNWKKKIKLNKNNNNKNVRIWIFMNVEGNNFRFADSYSKAYISFLVVYCDKCILLMGWFSFS